MTAPAPTFSTSKTLLGVARELQMITGVTAINDPLTTLNNKYNVSPNGVLTANPTIGYFGIGIDGFTNLNQGNLAQVNETLMTDMDLFTPIPFRCVPVAQDLDPTTRAQYRMRTKITVAGQQYFAYYLKVMSILNSTVQLTQTNPTTNVETPYTINYANMNPTPPTTPINGISSSATTEVNVTVSASLPITGAEVTEAVSVLYNNLNYARISEFGIYSGQDQTVQGVDGNGNALSYTEAIFAQLAYHYCWLGTDMSNPTSSQTLDVEFGNGSLLLM